MPPSGRNNYRMEVKTKSELPRRRHLQLRKWVHRVENSGQLTPSPSTSVSAISSSRAPMSTWTPNSVSPLSDPLSASTSCIQRPYPVTQTQASVYSQRHAVQCPPSGAWTGDLIDPKRLQLPGPGTLDCTDTSAVTSHLKQSLASPSARGCGASSLF